MADASCAERLYQAIRSSDLNTLNNLLDSIDFRDIESTWPVGDPPLVLASKTGRDVGLLRALVSHGCPVDVSSATGESALHCVAALWETSSLSEAIEVLLQAGCDPGLSDNLRRQLPLHLLAKRCGSGKKTSICSPVQRGDPHHVLHQSSPSVVSAMRLVTEKGCDVNARDHRSRTPLHVLATSHCNFDQPYLILLRNGADVGIQNDRGETALIEALECGALFSAELLLRETSSSVEIKTKIENSWLLRATLYGETALHVAARKDLVSLVALILRDNPQSQLTCARDLNGDTALHQAAARGHVEVAQLLVACESTDINAKNRKGLTPLHVAVESGFIHVVKLLLERPACDVLARTSDERHSSPFDLAQHEYRRRSHPEMSVILMREAERRKNMAVR